MADLTELEKALLFFDGCHRNGAEKQDLVYYIGVILASMVDGIITTVTTGNLTDDELRASPVPVSLPSGAHALTSVSGASTSTIAAGAAQVVFLPASDFVGTIDGVSYPGSSWQVIPFGAQPGKTLPAINLVVTSGTMNYYKLV